MAFEINGNNGRIRYTLKFYLWPTTYMNIEDCPHCRARVVPGSDGTCPSCKFNVYRTLTPEEKSQKAFAEGELRRARQDEIANGEFSSGCFLLVVGTLFVFASYVVAASPGSVTGGIYFIRLAPILAGLFLIFRGLVRSIFRR